MNVVDLTIASSPINTSLLLLPDKMIANCNPLHHLQDTGERRLLSNSLTLRGTFSKEFSRRSSSEISGRSSFPIEWSDTASTSTYHEVYSFLDQRWGSSSDTKNHFS